MLVLVCIYTNLIFCSTIVTVRDGWIFLRNIRQMLPVETASYIKGMHNLMGAHFDLLNHEKLAETIKVFEDFAKTKLVRQNDNNRILTYQYLYTAKINLYFLQGTFDKGLLMVPFLEKMLKNYGRYLDTSPGIGLLL